MREYGAAEVLRELREIDMATYLRHGDPAADAPVVIVGGSALILAGLTQRNTTHDVDVLTAPAAAREAIAESHMANQDVAAWSDNIPYNYEDRLREIDLPGLALRFAMPSPSVARSLTVHVASAPVGSDS